MPPEEEEDRAFHLAGDRLGDFVILAELGRGSMGVVYEAFQESLKRKVALKILPANISLDAKQVRRFRREAESVARLRHDNIIQIYEVGQVDNTHYFAMECVEGSTFDAQTAHDRDAIERTVRLTRDAARGLAHAHERGVIHRDIKPTNLLVDRAGRIVVTDFGLARLKDSASLTSTDAIVGTPKYMSPEQILPGRAPLDGRADVYSLGASLYEVLAGRPPLQAPSVQAFLKAVLEDRPHSPRRYNREVPHDLATIVMRCLEKEPEDRYEGARQLGADLDRVLKGERIVARPKGAFARGYGFVRRHRLLTSLAFVAVVALVASLWLTGRAASASGRATLLSRIDAVRTESDLDLAIQRAEDLAAGNPGDPAIDRLLRDLYSDRAMRDLEGLDVDFDGVRRDLERAGHEAGFWHLMALVETRRFEEAGRAALQHAPDDADRILTLARIALQQGDPDAAILGLSTLEGKLHPFCHLVLGRAYRERAKYMAAAGGDPVEVRRQRELALRQLTEGRRLAPALHQRWLRARIDLELFGVRLRMGESVRIGDVVGDLGAVAGEAMRRLTNVWEGMSADQADVVSEYVRRVLQLAGETPGPPALLERQARLRRRNTEARERAIGSLLLAVAHLSDGLPGLAQEVLSEADNEVDDAALAAYVLWGLSLVQRTGGDFPQAVGFALEALGWARNVEGGFDDLEPLARHATLLAEEAAAREETGSATRAARFLETELGRIEQKALWVSELLTRVRAVPTAPSR